MPHSDFLVFQSSAMLGYFSLAERCHTQIYMLRWAVPNSNCIPWLSSKALNEPYFTNDPIFRSFALKRSSTRILGTSDTLQHSWKQYHTLPDKPFSGQNCGHHTCLAVIGWPGRQYCRQNCGSSHTISLEIKIIRRRLRCICTRQGSNTLCLWPNDYAR